MSKVDGVTPDEAIEIVMNALSDRPSGPDPREVLSVIQAEAWDEGNIAGVFDLPSEKHATTNPYRSQA